MMRSTFAWKLFGGYVALIVLTALAVGVLHQRQVETDARQDLLDRLHSASVLLADLARPELRAGAVDAGFQSRLQKVARATDTRYTVIAESGSVLADSDENPRAMDNHGQRPEVRDARASGRLGHAQRFSATLGREMVYVAVPVLDDDGRPLGYARTSHPAADLADHLATLRRNMLIGAAIATVVGCVVAFLLAGRFTSRLRRVTAAAQAIAAGDHRRRVGFVGDDEVGRLAGAVDAMAHELASRLETITKERKEVLAILKSMVEGVVAVDEEQRVVLINDEARRILHVPTTQVTGRPLWEVTRMQAVCEIIDLVIRGAREARDEITLPQRGGDRCLELHSTPLRDEHDDVAGAVLVLHDITGLRRLEKVRRDFVANVSHELKTPLTAIRGFVETLLDDDHTEPETQRRFLGKIRDHTHRLSALVADLLTLSRVESQGIRPEQHPLDLREPVRASASLLQARADHKGLSLSIELPDEPVPVVGDSEALRQVIDNLLDNAIKYTPTGGRVRLRLRRRNGIVEIDVEDTGVGLEPQHQERIFERFYRVDRARSRELGGTGLGLSIVKHVVIAHQGQVSVQSEPGAGSRFRVILPVAAPAINGTDTATTGTAFGDEPRSP